MSLVALAVVLGALGQTGQVSRHEALFREQIEVKHDKATKVLMSHQQESQKVGSRAQRLQKFMKERDVGAPVGLGDKRDVQENGALLPEPVLCMSDMQQKGVGRAERQSDPDDG